MRIDRTTAHKNATGGSVMIKKNDHEERTDNDASTVHQELMVHAIKLLGSEERARAMLASGTPAS
jgi:hypothetical protein